MIADRSPVSRRDVMRWALLGAGASALPAWLAACSGDEQGAPPSTSRGRSTAPSGAVSPATTSSSNAPSPPPSTAPFDPTRPWWMQGNYAPIHSERERTSLRVRGSIPPELAGLYVRNGSNPAVGDSPHWFFGDGMVHGVRLERGRATWYGNHYVATEPYLAKAGFGEGAPGEANNQSNVSCTWHGGRLLASGEVGLPYELETERLTTLGPHDFGGRLTTAFTAHPKIDPATGRLHFFGYGFTAPFLTYHIADADGSLVHSEVVDIPRSTMMHDFAITDRDAVFWDLPVTFDLDAAIEFIDDTSTGGFPYAWTPDAGARVGVMPLDGGADRIQWFDIDPCFVFHGVNAFRRGDEVVVDVCRLASMFAPGELLGGEASLRRWTLDAGRGTVDDRVLTDDDPGDLPSRDPRRVGRDYRYGFLIGTRDNPDTVEFGSLIKHDFRTDRRERWDPGPTSHAGEWLFVPGGDDRAHADDDAGYLLSYVHDEATGLSELAIIDATDVTAGPIASVELPARVPYGFHAAWIPS